MDGTQLGCGTYIGISSVAAAGSEDLDAEFLDARIHTGKVCTASITKNSFIRGVPGVNRLLIAGIAGSNTSTGDCF